MRKPDRVWAVRLPDGTGTAYIYGEQLDAYRARWARPAGLRDRERRRETEIAVKSLDHIFMDLGQ